MSHIFDPDVIAAVRRHMNEDHRDDATLIAQAFSPIPDVIAAELTDFDGDAGQWHVVADGGAEDVIRIPWPGGPISERSEVRREVVALYDAACERMGRPPRAHD